MSQTTTTNELNVAVVGRNSSMENDSYTITIPNVHKLRINTDFITIYQVVATKGGISWQVPLRYSTIRAFHEQLANKVPHLIFSKLDSLFPSRAYFNSSASFVEKRRKKLEAYLRNIVTFDYIKRRIYLLRPLHLHTAPSAKTLPFQIPKNPQVIFPEDVKSIVNNSRRSKTDSFASSPSASSISSNSTSTSTSSSFSSRSNTPPPPTYVAPEPPRNKSRTTHSSSSANNRHKTSNVNTPRPPSKPAPPIPTKESSNHQKRERIPTPARLPFATPASLSLLAQSWKDSYVPVKLPKMFKQAQTAETDDFRNSFDLFTAVNGYTYSDTEEDFNEYDEEEEGEDQQPNRKVRNANPMRTRVSMSAQTRRLMEHNQMFEGYTIESEIATPSSILFDKSHTTKFHSVSFISPSKLKEAMNKSKDNAVSYCTRIFRATMDNVDSVTAGKSLDTITTGKSNYQDTTVSTSYNIPAQNLHAKGGISLGKHILLKAQYCYAIKGLSRRNKLPNRLKLEAKVLQYLNQAMLFGAPRLLRSFSISSMLPTESSASLKAKSRRNMELRKDVSAGGALIFDDFFLEAEQNGFKCELLRDLLPLLSNCSDLPFLLEIMLAIVYSLQKIHNAGVMHGRISPDHIYICLPINFQPSSASATQTHRKSSNIVANSGQVRAIFTYFEKATFPESLILSNAKSAIFSKQERDICLNNEIEDDEFLEQDYVDDNSVGKDEEVGEIVEYLAYCAPEQAFESTPTKNKNKNQSNMSDHRSDFYSLGVLFFTLLSGRFPYQAPFEEKRDSLGLSDTTNLTRMLEGWRLTHLTKKPYRIENLKSTIPPIIGDLLDKLLSKTPQQRYNTAYGLLVDLQRILRHCVAASTKQSTTAGIPKTPSNALAKKYHCPHFELASKDVSGHFKISTTLYGRSASLTTIIQLFRSLFKSEDYQRGDIKSRAGRAAELAFIYGEPGVGKTSFLQLIKQQLIKEKRLRSSIIIHTTQHSTQRSSLSNNFSSGSVPVRDYGDLASSIGSVVQFIQSQSMEESKALIDQICAALGPHTRLLADLFPVLGPIFPPAPPLAAVRLSPVEAINRFNDTFAKFISVLATEEHPVIFFFDNLDKGDVATLELIKYLSTSANISYCLIIGFHRTLTKSTTPNQPLQRLLRTFEDLQVPMLSIKLLPLELKHIIRLLTDTLQIWGTTKDTANTEMEELANLVKQKTNGNPFFVKHFLQTIYNEGLLYFMTAQNRHSTGEELLAGGRWCWNYDKLQTANYTENVIEFVTDSIKKMSVAWQQVLSLAACLGREFSLPMLLHVALLYRHSAMFQSNSANDLNLDTEISYDCDTEESEKVHNSVIEILGELVHAGMIQPVEEQPNSKSFSHLYKFSHDRIFKAGHNCLLDSTAKQKLHFLIGKIVLDEATKDYQVVNFIFDIVDQLNQAAELIISGQSNSNFSSTLLKCIELNIFAAKQALKSTAAQVSLTYLRYAISYFPASFLDTIVDSNVTETNTDIIDLYYEALFHQFLCEYIVGNNDNAEKLYEKVVANPNWNIRQFSEIIKTRMEIYTSKQQHLEAIGCGRQFLRKFNIFIPENASDTEIAALDEEIQNKLHEKFPNIEDLENLNSIYGDRSEKEHEETLLSHDLYNINKGEEKLKSLSKDIRPLTNFGKEGVASVAIMLILTKCLASAYFVNQHLFDLLAMKVVLYTFDHGHCSDSLIGLIFYAVYIAYIQHRYEEAFKLGTVVMNLLPKYPNNSGLITFVFGDWVRIWGSGNHIIGNKEMLLHSFQLCTSSGKFFYATYVVHHLSSVCIMLGEPLSVTRKTIERCYEFSNRILQGKGMAMNTEAAYRFVLELLDFSEEQIDSLINNQVASLSDKQTTTTPKETLPNRIAKHGTLPIKSWYYILQMQRYYWTNRIDLAYEMYCNSKLVLAASQRHKDFNDHHFWGSLILVKRLELSQLGKKQGMSKVASSAKEKEEAEEETEVGFKQEEESQEIEVEHVYNNRSSANDAIDACIKQVRNHLKILAEWANYSPVNFAARYHLVSAELAKIQVMGLINIKNTDNEEHLVTLKREAKTNYNLAIQIAQKGNFLNILGLTYELFARCYISFNFNQTASLANLANIVVSSQSAIERQLLVKAHQCYLQYEFQRRAKNLEAAFPFLANPLQYQSSDETTVMPAAGGKGVNAEIRLMTQMSNILAMEFIIGAQIKGFIKAIVEYSGAIKCVFLMHKENQLYRELVIEAQHIHTTGNTTVLQSKPIVTEFVLKETKEQANSTTSNTNTNNSQSQSINSSMASTDSEEWVNVHNTTSVQAQEVPELMINYSRSTKSPIIINDFEEEKNSEFVAAISDQYLTQNCPRSVLCLPVLYQNEIKGFLYLENEITPSVFKQVNLLLLNTVSAQIYFCVKQSRAQKNMQQLNLQWVHKPVRQSNLFFYMEGVFFGTWKHMFCKLSSHELKVFNATDKSKLANKRPILSLLMQNIAEIQFTTTNLPGIFKPSAITSCLVITSCVNNNTNKTFTRKFYFGLTSHKQQREWAASFHSIFSKREQFADLLAPNQSQLSSRNFPIISGTNIKQPRKLSENSQLVELSSLVKDSVTIKPNEVHIGGAIGKGAGSVVYCATWHGIEVAVKQLTFVSEQLSADLRQFKSELKMLQQLRHPNIVQFLGVIIFEDKQKEGGKTTAKKGGIANMQGVKGFHSSVSIVTELMSRGSLQAILEQVTLTNDIKLQLITDIVQGMIYLHNYKPPVVHRDLKPANIFISHNWRAKIGDFGLARFSNNSGNMTARVGSMLWMAPEVFAKSSYSELADVYSFAIVLWQIVTQENPFGHLEFLHEIAREVASGSRPIVAQSWKDSPVAYLLTICWQADPSYRPSFVQINSFIQKHSHDFFKSKASSPLAL